MKGQILNRKFRFILVLLSLLHLMACGTSTDRSPAGDDTFYKLPGDFYVESEDDESDDYVDGSDDSDMASPSSDRPIFHVWDLLTSFNTEKHDYGMYTYVLFGRRLNNRDTLNLATIDRYKNILNAITETTPTISEGEGEIEETNIFYIPVKKNKADDPVSLTTYNSSLSMKFISSLANLIKNDRKLTQRFTSRPGPFLISTFHPIGAIREQNVPFLYADLSDTNPDALKEVIRAYKIRISQEPIHEVIKFSVFRLKLLNFILNADDNLKIVKAALAEWYP